MRTNAALIRLAFVRSCDGTRRGRPRRRLPPHPLVADLLINPLDGRPGDTEGGFLLAGIARVSGVGVVESLAKNVLRALGKVRPHGWRQVGVDVVRHCGLRGVFRRGCSRVGDPGRRNDP